MRVIFEDEKKRISLKNGTVIALGNFDGIHIAHSKIIDILLEESQKKDLKNIVYTFVKHPENVLANRIFTLQITTNSQKIKILEQAGIDYLYFARFTEKVSNMPPEDFIKKILVTKFKVKTIIVGEDYRFGCRARGNVELLKQFAKEYNYEVITIPNIFYEGEKVCSTRIRREISQGNIEMANRLIGRILEIETKFYDIEIEENLHKYNIIDTTADQYLVIPRDGIYITQVKISGQIYNSITIVKSGIFKTSILDFNYEIYQVPKVLEILFYKKIRNYKNNTEPDKFCKQMDMDIKLVKNYFKKM